MDIDLLKTFVEVYHTRHFARAADNLFITPSAVSARIRQLESQLGTELFVRERSNIQLTRAGERFLSHARSMLRTWELACYEVAVDADSRPGLTLLVAPGLWDGMRLDWLRDLQDRQPGMSLRVETLNSNQITTRLQQNSADLGLMLEPVTGPELQLQPLGELALMMVSTRPGQSVAQALADRYVLVDWNTSFHAQHANAFPAAPTPRIWVSTGRLACDLLRVAGGAAYLPAYMVEAAEQGGPLHAVSDAPRISLRVYAASAASAESGALLRQALEAARRLF